MLDRDTLLATKKTLFATSLQVCVEATQHIEKLVDFVEVIAIPFPLHKHGDDAIKQVWERCHTYQRTARAKLALRAHDMGLSYENQRSTLESTPDALFERRFARELGDPTLDPIDWARRTTVNMHKRVFTSYMKSAQGIFAAARSPETAGARIITPDTNLAIDTEVAIDCTANLFQAQMMEALVSLAAQKDLRLRASRQTEAALRIYDVACENFLRTCSVGTLEKGLLWLAPKYSRPTPGHMHTGLPE